MSKRIKVTEIESPSTKFEKWVVELNKGLQEQYEYQYQMEWKPLEYEINRNYIKIIRDRSVWGFVALKDINTKHKSFRKGDLLKAAGYNSPAKHARGNIFEGTERYSLYGPVYLK